MISRISNFVFDFTTRYLCAKRDIKFWFQRRTRGWSDDETFSMDYSLAHLILPRLKRFRQLTIGTRDMETQEWHNKLDQMIAAFEFIVSENYWMAEDQDYQKHQHGLDLFAKHFTSLWW